MFDDFDDVDDFVPELNATDKKKGTRGLTLLLFFFLCYLASLIIKSDAKLKDEELRKLRLQEQVKTANKDLPENN